MKSKNYSISLAVLLFSLLIFQQSFAQVTAETLKQIQLLLQEKSARTLTQQKIDSRLLQAVREHRGEKMAQGVELEPANVNADGNGSLSVDIKGDISSTLLAKIESLGGQVIYASEKYHTLRASISLTDVENIAGYKEVKFIEPAVIGRTVDAKMYTGKSEASKYAERLARVRQQLMGFLDGMNENTIGKVTSQGDATHRADDVRTTYGYMGAGIRIGVLSDSYNSLGTANADVLSGDLPGTGNPDGDTIPVTVLQDIKGGSDEGRAMLQVST